MRYKCYTEKVQRILEHVHDFDIENRKFVSNRIKSYYDINANSKTFEADDGSVPAQPRKKGRTLNASLGGPYTVIKATNNVAYQIQLFP